MIICFEGIDGSGKSKQARFLADRLRARFWKFPNRETVTGKLLYAHLEGHVRLEWLVPLTPEGTLTPGNVQEVLDRRDVYRREVPQADALTFQALQLANRMECAGEIFEAAAKGSVVFDRYWPSGYAYGRADGLDGEYMQKLHSWLPQPDLFLLLDIDLEDSMARRPERRDRYEVDGAKLREVADHYRELWAARSGASPLRWRVINGRLGVAEVTAAVEQAVADARTLG
jgi:dTMP kinase